MCSCQRQQVPPVLLAVPVDDTQKMLIFFKQQYIVFKKLFIAIILLSDGDTVSKSDYKS